MVRLPFREAVDVFAETEYRTEPAPVPLAPEVTVIQLVLLAALQAHDPPVLTVTLLLVEADAPTDPLVGVSEYEQAPACVTLTVCPATVRLPDRWLVDVFAATE
jgi:hypothetical protein